MNDFPLAPHGLDPERMLPFVCLGSECQSSCCGPFHGTTALRSALDRSDLGELLPGAGTGDEPDPEVSIFAFIRLTAVDLARVQDAGYDHLVERRGRSVDPAYYLRLRSDGSCAALDENNMCSIHPYRPTICRAFPFYIDLFAGLSMVESCPGINAGESSVSDLQEEIRATIAMYEFWIEQIRQPSESD